MNRRTKTAFGEFLVGEIKQAGISQEEFYTAVGIKKPYFYDLAAQGRDEIPADITAIIKNHSNDWDQIRAVLTASIQGRRVRYPL